MKNLKKIALALGGLSAICAGFAVGTVASTQKAAKPTLATSGMDTTIYFDFGDAATNSVWAVLAPSPFLLLAVTSSFARRRPTDLTGFASILKGRS